jgi:hypothetical protein
MTLLHMTYCGMVERGFRVPNVLSVPCIKLLQLMIESEKWQQVLHIGCVPSKFRHFLADFYNFLEEQGLTSVTSR